MSSKEITFPLILVNLKSYLEAIGNKAEELAQIAEDVSKDVGVCIGLASQPTEIKSLSKFKIPIFSQHIDLINAGSYTGHILPEAIAMAGAVGTIINHSERRLILSDLESTIVRARSIGLTSVVCANSIGVGIASASLNPEIIAIEPPELIGSGIAVSKAKPEIISQSVEAIRKINSKIIVLCGAGISSGSDVSAAIKLGTSGVLVSSGVVKAPNWRNILREFAHAAADL